VEEWHENPLAGSPYLVVLCGLINGRFSQFALFFDNLRGDSEKAAAIRVLHELQIKSRMIILDAKYSHIFSS